MANATVVGILRSGTAAARPAANSVTVGTVYFATDTLVATKSDGTTWNAFTNFGSSTATTWTSGSAVPSGGNDGDFYIRTTNYDLYKKISGTWTVIGNIAGATGAAGSTGPAGGAGLLTNLQFVIDGGGAVITTGVWGDIEVPASGTITAVRLFGDVSGSIVVDIWKDTYANYPPTVGDSIVASAKPTLSSAIKSQDVTLTGWSKSVAPGDILRFNVESASTVTRVNVSLTIQPT